jgi:hypothetical protein
MSTYLKVSAMALLITMAGMAAPLCTTTTYTAYQTLGAGGCTIGDETFSNFSALAFSNSLGVTPLTSDQILVTPSAVGTESSLAFTYGTAANPITITLVDSDQVFAFDFTYQAVAATGFILSSIQQAATYSNTTPGSVSFTKNAQSTGGGTIFTSAVADNGSNHVSATYTGPITSVTTAGGSFLIKDAISLQGQTGAVTNSGFTNNFVVSPGTNTGVPEPPVSLLIGSGLVLLASVTRKAAERRRRVNN